MNTALPGISSRKSDIELLKIFAVLLIITSHVVQTLGTYGNTYITFNDYYFNLYEISFDVRHLITGLLFYCGELGNTIFFICSAWFLLDTDKVSKKKILIMLMDLWVISMTILAAVLIIRRGNLPGLLIFQSLFPVLFENNWYVSCYVIFYAFHPVLNRIINTVERRTLFRINAAGLILYPGLAFIFRPVAHVCGAGTTFFYSRLIIWAELYFLIGYAKKNHPQIFSNTELARHLIVLGLAGNCGVVILTDLLSYFIYPLKNARLIWGMPFNPCLISLSFGLFLLALKCERKSRIINTISSVSLFIYLIHENLLIRTLYRPLMWEYIYLNYGYDHLMIWIFLLVVIIFIISLIVSLIYKYTLHKILVFICSRLYTPLADRWKSLESKLLSM